MLQPYDVAGATMTNHIWRTLTRDEAGWAGGGDSRHVGNFGGDDDDYLIALKPE